MKEYNRLFGTSFIMSHFEFPEEKKEDSVKEDSSDSSDKEDSDSSDSSDHSDS